jgi:hypothetical protein
MFEPKLQKEDTQGIILGHPDIVTRDCVYDIKTSGRFNSMRSETILQILSYYCLFQVKSNIIYEKYPLNKESFKIRNVGLILPAQHLIFKVNLKDWNWKPFWKSLVSCISSKEVQKSNYSCSILEKVIWDVSFTTVGGGITKKRF